MASDQAVRDIVAQLVASQQPEVQPQPTMGALASIQAARDQLATQSQRMPISYGAPDQDQAAMAPETFINPAVAHALGSLVRIR